MYETLRGQALSLSPADLGLPADAAAYGVVFEFAIDNETVTIVAFATGDASIYFSSGGGMIGGIEHPAVVDAAKAFVRAAEGVAPRLSPTAAFPRPAVGEMRFYVLTGRGVVTASAPEGEVIAGDHMLSPLFFAANDLITQYRLIQQR